MEPIKPMIGGEKWAIFGLPFSKTCACDEAVRDPNF